MIKKILKILITSIIGFFLLVAAFLAYNYYPVYYIPSDIQIDKLVVNKSKRELLAYSNGNLVKVYKVALGGQPLGHKEFEGDEKTPEGLYYINDKNPFSSFHRNLGISYPNQQDIEHAKSLGKSPGGDIKIHGLGRSMHHLGKLHRQVDWTLGCIAVTDDEIEELFRAVKVGSPIYINP